MQLATPGVNAVKRKAVSAQAAPKSSPIAFIRNQYGSQYCPVGRLGYCHGALPMGRLAITPIARLPAGATTRSIAH